MAGPVVTLGVGGYTDATGQEAVTPAQSNDGKPAESKRYFIPPAIWMFVFLIAGYFGFRAMVEE